MNSPMSAEEPGGPLARYQEILADLRAKSANAARRNKPTMWAYYLDMEAGLLNHFRDVIATDAGYAGAALALSQRAQSHCSALPPAEAARLWALGIYARRILASWGAGTGGRVSLAWLHDRAYDNWTTFDDAAVSAAPERRALAGDGGKG